MSPATTRGALSPECALARRPRHGELHSSCTRTEDVPFPYSPRVLLAHRCGRACHHPTPAVLLRSSAAPRPTRIRRLVSSTRRVLLGGTIARVRGQLRHGIQESQFAISVTRGLR